MLFLNELFYHRVRKMIVEWVVHKNFVHLISVFLGLCRNTDVDTFQFLVLTVLYLVGFELVAAFLHGFLCFNLDYCLGICVIDLTNDSFKHAFPRCLVHCCHC